MAEKWTQIYVNLHGFLEPIEYGVPGISFEAHLDH